MKTSIAHTYVLNLRRDLEVQLSICHKPVISIDNDKLIHNIS